MRTPVLALAALAVLAGCEDKPKSTPPAPTTSSTSPVLDPPPPARAIDAAPPARDGGIDMRLGAARSCVEPQSRRGLCACLFDTLDPDAQFGFDDEHDDDLDARERVPSCKPAGKAVAQVAIWRVSDARAATEDAPHGYFLVTEVDRQFAALGTLRGDLGRTRQTLATYEPGAIEQRRAGDRDYLWIAGRERDVDFAGGVSTQIDARQITVCPLPASAASGCPLQVPVRTKTTIELEWDEPDYVDEFRATWEQNSPVVRVVELDVDIRGDGSAVVSLATGKPTDWTEPFIGTHAIW